MKRPDYDLVIIGEVPLGLLRDSIPQGRLNVILIEKMVLGGQILVTDWIENYPGFPEGISGADFVQRMTEQVKRFDLKIETNSVISMDLSKPVKKINLSDKTITAYAIIIATGASPQKLAVPGEDTFLAKAYHLAPLVTGHFSGTAFSPPLGGVIQPFKRRCF